MSEKIKPDKMHSNKENSFNNSGDYKFYYWGPYLHHTRLPDDVCKEMLKRGEKLKYDKDYDYREKLAGNIRHEYVFSKEDRKYFTMNTMPIFDVYMKCLRDWSMHALNQDTRVLKVYDLWINFMGPDEYNPTHTHDGDLSFVFFPKVPKELETESHNYKGTGAGPGRIEFTYGEKQGLSITGHSFLPETNDLFIFPSTLKHFVYPYKSKVERVSISGNINFEDYKGKPLPIPMNYE